MRLSKHLLSMVLGKRIKKKHFASGYTTHMFKAKDKRYLIGYTLDKDKIKWLKHTKAGEFKLLKTFTKHSVTIYKYKILKMKQLSTVEKVYLEKELLNLVRRMYNNGHNSHNVSIAVPHLLYFVTDDNFKLLLNNVLKVFKNDEPIGVDLHHAQFVIWDGKITCIDPVYKEH